MPQDISRPTRGASLTQQVMDHVRNAIRNRTLRQGEMYSVYQLADQLGVSRAPVREALTRLEEAGLIVFSRNRGFEVTPIDALDVAEIFSLRIALEVPAARRAAGLASAETIAEARDVLAAMRECADEGDEERFFDLDQRFHQTILASGGGRRLNSIVDHLRLTLRLAQGYTTHGERSMTEITDEHAPILSALESGDAESAADAMRSHLHSTARVLFEHLRRTDGAADDHDVLGEMLAGF